MNNEFLTLNEVAKILKVSSRAVSKMIHTNRIKGVHISGDKRKSYRILKGELDRFVAKQYEKKGE